MCGSRALFSLLFLFLSASGFAHARSVEAEGVAAIQGSTSKARAAALQNAMRQAAMQASSHISSATLMSDNAVVADSMRLRSSGRVENVVVLDEWTEESTYHVLIRADIPVQRKDEPAASYRKKVAFTQFQILDRRQTGDLSHIEMELPKELMRRMEKDQGVIGVDATQYLFAQTEALAYGINTAPANDQVVRAAKQLGVQFVVAGTVRDMGIIDDMLGHSRRLELEWQLFDGISGTLISRTHYKDVVTGAGLMALPALLTSPEFIESPFGKAIVLALNAEAATLRRELDQLPFSARVIRSEGNKIYFDAGGTAQVRVGDVLMTYKVEEIALTDPVNGKFLGYAEQPATMLVVRTVQPLFGVGELEKDDIKLRAGDIVRFGW